MVLFPQTYKVSLGKANEALHNESVLFVMGPGVWVLVTVLACTLLLYALHLTSYSDALRLMVIVEVGYLVANTTNIAINPNIPWPFPYSTITSSLCSVGWPFAHYRAQAFRVYLSRPFYPLHYNE
jgi:uncharacterized membrane protein